ncbi:dTDP-4-dehydrorhamnose reductase [Paenibacillus shirakamiensis]|uniref:dTDP-4-dehydrorhamnose reductase n=1 Tax=Paenibacillus shirakamiensis TaxID=1265935 RepID=A0ABS4JHW3_9BACL|nr:dTDP-4-dehydrorhamnose reductase [Paenibacillus shirakamiensis]MBP2000701.1 dTDP-4-dehydrorhamnose reductase [Paenibacillus shirakamiensis]
MIFDYRSGDIPGYKRKIVVTGAGGQLGRELVALLTKQGYAVTGLGRAELDITDAEACREKITSIRPDVVIHAAAYTQVDQAETDVDLAYQVNAWGTRNMAVAAASSGAKLVYISTDYVFNGEGTTPYDEFHLVDPINVYGRSKWEGEQFVRQMHNRFFIIRTSWVYGEYGPNFVKTMLNLATTKDQISVVEDQVGCPTYTLDLGMAISKILRTENYGTYHITGAGSCSWCSFAKAVFEISGLKITVLPVTSHQFVRAAPRPAYSVLEHQALRLNGFKEMRPWREALEEFLIQRSSNEIT